MRTPNRFVQIAVHCTWLILSRGDGAPIPSRRVSQLLNCPSGLGRGRSHGIILPAVAQRGPTGFDPGRQIICCCCCCCCCGRCASPNTFSAPPSNLRSDSHIYFTARKSQGDDLPGHVSVSVWEETEEVGVVFEPLQRMVFEEEGWRHALAVCWRRKRRRRASVL